MDDIELVSIPRAASQVFFNLGPVEFPEEMRAKMQFFAHELQKVRASRIERVTVKMVEHV